MSTQITAPQNDVFVFNTIEQLQAMSLQEVEALWELVPTERQRLYKAIYDRVRRDEGATSSDTREAKVVGQLIQRYQEFGTVPILQGNIIYWPRTPDTLRIAASQNTQVEHSEVVLEPKTKQPPKIVIIIGGVAILLFLFIFMRGLSARGAKAAGSGTATATGTPTPTLEFTLTPTPLALDAQDSIIRGGDTSSSSSSQLYPVNLRVAIADEQQPRIFVVQRRTVTVAEWNYVDNPDTASFISGLIVRPVLGIPWSADNEALFNTLGPGSSFVLRMNTGTAMTFSFASRMVVNRSDTDIFRQVGPGLVLILIGQRDSTTQELTSDRVVITANYQPEKEIAQDRITGIDLPKTPIPTPTLTATPVQRIDVQVISAESLASRVQIRLRIYNGHTEKIALAAGSIWLMYGYVAQPVGPRMTVELSPLTLEPGQAADVTVNVSWHGEPFATLGVFDDYQFALTFGGTHE